LIVNRKTTESLDNAFLSALLSLLSGFPTLGGRGIVYVLLPSLPFLALGIKILQIRRRARRGFHRNGKREPTVALIKGRIEKSSERGANFRLASVH
jgi:hypothetical protein